MPMLLLVLSLLLAACSLQLAA
uniref:Uncharacterized protein n=1 Tax=Pseudomonas graminis TaxID=158627 RepID=A0A7C1X0E5_9PSED